MLIKSCEALFCNRLNVLSFDDIFHKVWIKYKITINENCFTSENAGSNLPLILNFDQSSLFRCRLHFSDICLHQDLTVVNVHHYPPMQTRHFFCFPSADIGPPTFSSINVLSLLCINTDIPVFGKQSQGTLWRGRMQNVEIMLETNPVIDKFRKSLWR